ncbi:MAG: hypothetical protein Q8L02_05610 [Candidatus Nitrotoga sp.]|nr:hypothetical protein [Candidatus Nitrotoga sp.]
MLTGVQRAFVAVILVACLGIGCKPFANTSEPNKTSHRQPTSEVPVTPGQYGKKIIPRDEKLKPLQVFAEKSFYLERPEPEEVLIGVFQLAHVREGPNTRDMPFRLVVGTNKLNVYVAGLDVETLRPYVGHEVEVVGKRIDQRIEGYGIEIWIATIENTVSESK